MSEWKLSKVENRCLGCETTFEPDQSVVSLVTFDADDKPVRLDYCSGCFGEGEDGPASDRFFWETKWTPPEQKRRKIDFERLRQLFEHWLRVPPEGQQPLIYLVALLLVRKRFYRMLDLVTENDEECLRLRRPGPDQKPFLAPAPLLRPSDLPPLREQLERLLDGDFDDEDLPEESAADA